MNHRVKLTREDGWQIIRVPRELELPGDEVTLHQDRGRLVVETSEVSAAAAGLLALLATLEPLRAEDRMPAIDDDELLPLDEIDL
jgi:antitoxin VapB